MPDSGEPKLEEFLNTIGGKQVAALREAWIESFYPYTGEPWARVPLCDSEDVDKAVEAAHAAFTSSEWRTRTATQRGKLLRRVGDLIAENADRLAELEVRDNGKLLSEMAVQVKYVPEWFYYYGGLADKIEGAVLPIDKPDMFTYTKHEPLGVVACIVPWNSPLLLLTWKIAPALAAGNTVVIKPSEYASVSTLEFVKLFEEAGFPPGVVNTVTGYGPDVGAPLVEHDLVRKVAFTGGEMGGVSVYEAAAKGLKGVTLELGGKSPNIVFEDADLDNAVKGAISGIFAATGQTCIAGSRLLVQKSIEKEFTEKLVEFAKTARMGDPLDMETQVGPVTTKAQYEKVLKLIDSAKAEGADVLLGGGKPNAPELGDGWFVEPTIFGSVDNSMKIAQEEVFGPVLSVISFEDEADAVRLANDVVYGLAAGMWTSDMGRAIRMSDALEAGMVWVNTYRAVSFMAPFGGYKRSGLGRESGKEAIYEFLQTKTTWISLSDKVANPFIIR